METFTSLEYLKIDVATNFGLDKEDWQPRIKWTDNHLSEIMDMVAQVQEGNRHPLLKQADEPALFYAGCKALADALHGQEISYPISKDATASGAQLMAVLIRCEKSARLCNVVNAGFRVDYYTANYELYNKAADEALTKTRGEMKDAIMPYFYGSEAQPQKVFGKDTKEMNLFLEIMEENSPGIVVLRDALMRCWDGDTYAHEWVMPDNFHVKIKVESVEEHEFLFKDIVDTCTRKVNAPVEKGIKNAAHVIHSTDGFVVREMVARCDYDVNQVSKVIELLMGLEINRAGESGQGAAIRTKSKNARMVQTLVDRYKDSGFLSVRILDYIDEDSIHLVPREPLAELVKSLPDQPFSILTVHD